MTLTTLADVRELIKRHLPAETREKSSWLHVARWLDEAAHGVVEAIDVYVPLQTVLAMEGVECHAK